MRSFTLIFICLSIASVTLAQESASEKLARRHAQKLGDLLALSQSERDSVLKCNLSIADQKRLVFQDNLVTDSVLAIKVQRIEDSRDSIYFKILGLERFEIYRTRKTIIINNN